MSNANNINHDRMFIVNAIWLVKLVVIAIVFIILIFWFYLHLSLDFLGINVGFWIGGFLLSIIFAYVIRLFVFCFTLKVDFKDFPKILKSELNIKSVPRFLLLHVHLKPKIQPNVAGQPLGIFRRFIKPLLMFLITPDYYYALTFKEWLDDSGLNVKCTKRDKPDEDHLTLANGQYKCKVIEHTGIYECELLSKRDRRKHFIQFANWTNVIISVLFLCVVAFAINNEWQFLIKFLVAILLFRLLSRTIEIAIAFYDDVVKAKMDKKTWEMGFKSSSLKKGNRISLAVHSYIELCILFAIVYMLSDKLNYFSVDDLDDMKGFLDYLLYSFSVSAFNISLEKDFTTFQKVLHSTQVAANLTLVVLSIASYMGMEDTMSDVEKARYQKDNPFY